MTAAVGGSATPAPAPAERTGGAGPAGRVPPRARQELRSFVELFALAGFAVAQPLFDVFGRAPDQFIFRGARSRDIVAFALIVLVVPPLVLWLVEAVVGLVSSTARTGLHVAFLSLLVAAFAVQVLRSLATGVVLMVVAAGLGALAGFAYHRTTAARLWLGFAAVAPPVFCALFLLASQTAPLLREPGAQEGVRIGRPGPVVMIVFDELPLAALIDADGEIDAELFPNFARLADESHWFRNTTAISNFTWTAVPSMLTSTLPRDDTTPTASSHPKSLFTLLAGSMDLDVTESVTRVCPTSLCDLKTPEEGGLPGLLRDAREVMAHRLAVDPADVDPVAGLASHGDSAEPTEDGPAAAAQSGTRIDGFLDGLATDTDTLHYLHVVLPHVPYRYLPDGTSYAWPTPEIGIVDNRWSEQAGLADLGRQRMALQLGYADRVLGQAMDRMVDEGTYDAATFVVVADHGIAFQPGGSVRGLDTKVPLTDPVAAEIAWVPFFLKEPGQRDGERSDANVSTIDVLPTIADVLDVDIPWDVDGRSALGPPRADNDKVMYLNAYAGTEIKAGEPYEIDGDEGWPLVLDRSIDRLLPDGPGGAEARFFRVGDRPELVGTEADSAPAGLLRPTTLQVLPDSYVDDVEPSSGRVPALMMGLVPDVSPGAEVALALNGRIVAVVPAYADGDTVRVAAMAPLSAFRAGANDLQAYRVG